MRVSLIAAALLFASAGAARADPCEAISDDGQIQGIWLSDRSSPGRYATTRTGYKSSGFNVAANVLILRDFGPEKVKDHKLGVKADFKLGGMAIVAGARSGSSNSCRRRLPPTRTAVGVLEEEPSLR